MRLFRFGNSSFEGGFFGGVRPLTRILYGAIGEEGTFTGFDDSLSVFSSSFSKSRSIDSLWRMLLL